MWMRRTTGAFIDARPARSGVGGGDRQARSAAHVQHSFAAHLPGRGSEAETPDALALQMQVARLRALLIVARGEKGR